MKILIACEFSGEVRDAFTSLGHDATSCDLLPTDRPGKHYQGDVFDILDNEWDLVIAHPPCTYLCNSGVRWLYNKDGSRNVERWENMVDGANFFRAFIDRVKCPLAIENPIMHKYALQIIGQKATQFIQPYMFGHGEQKATGLWLFGLPALIPTNIVQGREQKVHRMTPSPDRWKDRSKTFPGIAHAMASQWGSFISEKINPIKFGR